jgi:uncharacterized protein YceK
MKHYVLLGVILFSGCTSVQQVMDNKDLYCNQLYKGMRAVGRSALSATTGVVVRDVCYTIDGIIAEEQMPSDKVGA